MEDITGTELLVALFPTAVLIVAAFCSALVVIVFFEWKEYQKRRACPTCKGSGDVSWQDRDANGLMDLCYYCRGKGWVGSLGDFVVSPIRYLFRKIKEVGEGWEN